MTVAVHHRAHRVATPIAILSILLAFLISGCSTSKPRTLSEDGVDGYGGVSAREYGFVRPAGDVWMLGDDGWRSPAHPRIGDTGDLWSRVRAGMKLNRYANPRIDAKVATFRRDPQYLAKLSGRAKPYLHVIVDEIDRRGLPAELALLPHVESRYNPAATSPAAAAGMWQFIPSTGRIMGLQQNGQYDGRRDILASTRAALDYLEELHRELGSWELAMAAYNCGPVRVESAQAANRRRGQPTDFWHLHLPSETENYVPQILAAARLISEPAKYGMRLPPVPSTPQLEVVATSKPVDLHSVARAGGIQVDQLRRLNAGLKRGRTGSDGPSHILVPAGTGQRVSAKLGKARVLPAVAANAQLYRPARSRRASLHTSRAPQPTTAGRIHVVRAGETLTSIAKANRIDPQVLADFNAMRVRDPLLPGQSLRIPNQSASDNLFTHKVQKGDSLATIARRYGVSVKDLRHWNPATAHDLRAGDLIRVQRSAI